MARTRDISARFSEKYMVEPNSGCWLWTGTIDRGGYGTIYYTKQKRSEKAHRVSHEIHKGPIPKELWVLHSCDVRCCVNPAYLRLGTPLENNLDCVKRGRHVPPDNRGENQGRSKLTAEQVADIRARRMIQREYAALYGVTRQTISDIQVRRSWDHV